MPAAPRRATAAALALTISTGALSACGASTSPPKTAPSTGAPSTPPTTPAGTSAAGPPPAAWSRATSPALAVGGGATSTFGSVLAPVQAGAPWVVAGTRTGADGSATATVWTSPDATTWTSTPLTAPGVASAAAAVTTFGQRTVVVGSVGTGPDRRAAVWASPAPGSPFAPVPDQAAFAAGAASGTPTGAEMHVVAAGAIGLFAAGTAGGQQAMWYSTDGRHFTRVTDAERVIDGASQADVRSIVVTPGGVFAAGSSRDGVATDGTLWTSTDGIKWAQETDAQHAFSGNGNYRITGLATMARGTAIVFEAVGAVDTNGTSSPASWISPDGFSWSSPSLSFPRGSGRRPDPDGATIDAVAATSTGLVAVGGGDGTALAWTSGDGRSWTPLALPATAASAPWHAGLVAATATTTVVADPDAGTPRLLVEQGAPIGAVGTPAGAPPAPTWTEATSDAVVWGSPRSSAVPVTLLSDGRTLRLIVDVTQPGQLLGQDHTTVAVLTSTDGSAWTAAATGGAFTDAQAAGAVDTPTGLVAVGAQAATTTLLAAAEPAGAAWTSPDGATWTAATATAGGFGTGGTATGLTGVTRVTDGTLLAVGTGPAGASPGPGGHPLAWTSPTGTTWTAAGGLDRAPGLLDATPRGVCRGPAGAVAVGDGAVASPGRQAMAWTTASGSSWSRASLPTPVTGGTDSIMGCAPLGQSASPVAPGSSTTGSAPTTAASAGTGAGVIAWGKATATDGATEPALWQSTSGATWTRRKVAAFIHALPAPLTDVAQDGPSWLAVGGGTVPATDTAPGGGLGLWRSQDAGATWARVDTSGPPWQASTSASVQHAAWLAGTAVVAGTIDGQLAVWVSGSPGG